MNPFKSRFTIIGQTIGRYDPRTFGIKLNDRFSHVYVLGKTGVGKSTLLQTMIHSDLQAGHGLCVIDPHGSLVQEVVQQADRPVIAWQPGDADCPYGYNMLGSVPKKYQSLVTSGIIEVLKNQWSDAWGVRMEHILRYALLALLETDNHTLLDVARLLRDRQFRNQIVPKIQDSEVKAFWKDEFRNYSIKASSDGIAPILNKLGGFLSNPLVRKALCEPDNPLRLGQIMQHKQALLIDLSIGRLGRDVSAILGGMLATVVSLAGYTRADHDRRHPPFFLYLDEFQNFTTLSVAHAMAELRKYRVGLVIAHQYRSSLSKDIRDAVTANAGTQILFRQGYEDANRSSHELKDRFTVKDIMNLPNYRFYASLLINEEPSRPFSGETMPPEFDRKDK